MNLFKLILEVFEALLIFILGLLIIRNIIIKPLLSKMLQKKHIKIAQGILVIIVQISLYYLVTRLFPEIIFAVSNGILGFLIGSLLGGLTMGVNVVILMSSKVLKIEKNIGITKEVIFTSMVFFTLMALLEEIAFRGILYGLLRAEYSFLIVVGVTTVVFAIPHLFNAGMNVRAATIVLLLGFLLGLIREFTGDIWLAFGFHLIWNYLQAFLGINVSGDLEFNGGYKSTFKGKPFITGGKFGIEASIVSIIGLLISNAILLFYMTN
jgi:membrane protease YdiL (CAAX protease family)